MRHSHRQQMPGERACLPCLQGAKQAKLQRVKGRKHRQILVLHRTYRDTAYGNSVCKRGDTNKVRKTILPALAPAFLLTATSWPALAAPPPLDAYGDLPSVEDMAISPGGKIATLAKIGGEARVVAIDPEGNILFSAPAGKSKIRWLDWADDKTLLVTNTATVSLGPTFTLDKYEMTGTIVISLDPYHSEMLFSRTASIANTTRGRYGIRKVDGKTTGYFGGIAMDVSGNGVYFRHGRAGLYAVDLSKDRARLVAKPPSEGHYTDWLVDTDGTVAATLDVSEDKGAWHISNARHDTLAQGLAPTGDISLLSFGKDGSTIIYAIEDEDGNKRWFEVPLVGGTPQEFLADTAVERIYTDRTSGRIIGYRERSDTPKTVMFDPVLDKLIAKIFAAFPGRDTRLVDWTPDFTKVLVRTNGNKDSGTWFIVDLPHRRADPIGNERPLINASDVGPISKVDYAASDGLEMDGILTLPPGREARNLPVIVFPHGGPASHDEVAFDWWAQAFASRGYAVFQPNFRGSTNRGDAFQHAGDGEWGHRMLSDMTDGLAELVKRGIVDPKRACIMGASYGGYAALAGVTLQQGFYRCSVAVAGVADVDMMYDADVYASNGSRMTKRVLRQFLGDPKGYDSISPRKFASRADAPILLIHGKDDTVVYYKQSLAMADALKDAHKPYEFVTLKEEDHWLSRADTRKQMLQAAMAFVQKYNPAD